MRDENGGQHTARARIQDLKYLEDEFGRLNRSFTPETAGVFRQRLAVLAERAGEMTQASFIMGIAHAVAAADDGHTDVLALEHFRRVPLRFYWFNEGLHITCAAPAHRALLGARIDSIAQHKPEEVLERLRRYIPGHENRVRNWSTAYMSSGDALQGIGLPADASNLQLDLRLRDGTQVTESFVSQAWGGQNVRIREWRNLLPRVVPDGLRGDCTHLLDEKERLPLFLSEPDKPYWHTWNAAKDVLYLQVTTTNNVGPTRLDDYLKGVLECAAAHRPAHIIIDLRFNSGGMFSLIYFFCLGVRKVLRDGGRIFVITGISTFSAGICMTAFLKHFGAGQTVLVGERVSDRERFWAEGDCVCLPNCGLKVNYVDGYFDLSSDRLDFKTHYWMNVVYAAPVASLDPDVPARLSFSDYAAGRDPCMEAIVAHLDS